METYTIEEKIERLLFYYLDNEEYSSNLNTIITKYKDITNSLNLGIASTLNSAAVQELYDRQHQLEEAINQEFEKLLW